MPKAKTHRILTKETVTGSALEIIREQMLDGGWYSLAELAFIAGISESGASARIRDLRKPYYGDFTIESKAAYGGGSWLYRMVLD